jgi:hypothetical protein
VTLGGGQKACNGQDRVRPRGWRQVGRAWAVTRKSGQTLRPWQPHVNVFHGPLCVLTPLASSLTLTPCYLAPPISLPLLGSSACTPPPPTSLPPCPLQRSSGTRSPCPPYDYIPGMVFDLILLSLQQLDTCLDGISSQLLCCWLPRCPSRQTGFTLSAARGFLGVSWSSHSPFPLAELAHN